MEDSSSKSVARLPFKSPKKFLSLFSFSRDVSLIAFEDGTKLEPLERRSFSIFNNFIASVSFSGNLSSLRARYVPLFSSRIPGSLDDSFPVLFVPADDALAPLLFS